MHLYIIITSLINADENGRIIKIFCFVFMETKMDTFETAQVWLEP